MYIIYLVRVVVASKINYYQIFQKLWLFHNRFDLTSSLSTARPLTRPNKRGLLGEIRSFITEPKKNLLPDKRKSYDHQRQTII